MTDKAKPDTTAEFEEALKSTDGSRYVLASEQSVNNVAPNTR